MSGLIGKKIGMTSFFDANGKECDSDWRDRVISIDMEQLRKTPEVVGVIAGSDRSDAIRAAVKGKLLKSLVIDEAGARALLEAKTLKH